ncbi:MAG: hypothetical protein WKF79_00355 [Nocardioides sp.]
MAAREFLFNGVEYETGDPFGPFDESDNVSDRMRQLQYESRVVNHGEDAPASEDAGTGTGPVAMTESETRHTYLITAPWLDEPERVRGKANAEKRLAEVQADGPPVGYIEGGSEVTVEEGGGGWFTITAPGQEPEKVQGREAAQARFLELHQADPVDPDAPPVDPDAPPADPDAPDGGEGTETDDGASTEGSTEESDMIDDKNAPPTDGDKPNEPGTNQPNGAEVINDAKAAEPGNARSDTAGEDPDADDDGTDGGDGTTGTVGP